MLIHDSGYYQTLYLFIFLLSVTILSLVYAFYRDTQRWYLENKRKYLKTKHKLCHVTRKLITDTVVTINNIKYHPLIVLQSPYNGYISIGVCNIIFVDNLKNEFSSFEEMVKHNIITAYDIKVFPFYYIINNWEWFVEQIQKPGFENFYGKGVLFIGNCVRYFEPYPT